MLFVFFLSNLVQLFEKKETKKCKNFSKFKFSIAIGRKETLRSQEIEKNVQIIVHLKMNSPRTYGKKNPKERVA